MARGQEEDGPGGGRRAARRRRIRAASFAVATLVLVAAVVAVVVSRGGEAPSPPPAAGGASPQAASAPAPVEVWAVGDAADGSESAQRVARTIADARPDRLLYLGDVYESGTAREFDANYDTAFGALAKRTLPTPGNHDWPNHGEGYLPYWKGVTGRPMPTAYAGRLGGWEVLSLNSETADTDSRQLQWLRERVASGGTCRLAFWHRPRYSAGKHGDQPEVEGFWRRLRGRAALVVNGHEHNMQELRPRDGVRELISGAGGHSHYEADEDDSRLDWLNTSDYGALRLRLRPGRADYAFVAVDGRVLREGTARCRPA